MAAANQENHPRKASEEVLQSIRESQDIAAWYRMLSKDQLKAIWDLTNALRDDGEQGSTYRVHTCLSTLGIYPLIKRKWLKKLICMSRGSDLAFLYFLWEGFYRCNRSVYTYNEQILMSSIMHLDLEMTLNELENILPPGHLSAENQERLDKRNSVKKKPPQSRPKAPVVSQAKKKGLPYFWRQPRPKQITNLKSKTSKRTDVVVSFSFWPVGKNPNYKLGNANRWFASYQLNPVRREIYRMVKGFIEDYWNRSFSALPVKDSSEEMLCDTHKEALEQEQLAKDELILKAHEHLLELIDVTARENKKRKKRIINQLNKDIDDCTLRWQKLQRTQYTETKLLRDCNLCQLGRVTTTPQDEKVKCLVGPDDINPIAHFKTAATAKVLTIGDNDIISVCKAGDVSDSEEDSKHISYNDDGSRPDCPVHLGRPFKKKCLGKSIAFSNAADKATKEALFAMPNKYFKAPQLHQPYEFNYHHTFHQCCQSAEPIEVIHRQALRSLKASGRAAESSNEMKGKICTCKEPTKCTKENVIAAIVKCAEDMWKNTIKSFQGLRKIPLGSRQGDLMRQPGNCLSNDEESSNSKYLSYNRTYYDPNDSKLMETMLSDGMNVLRKDPRFVFASFPDAHKTILMREWIKRRYGKTYTQEEILETMKDAGLAFRAVIKLQKDPPIIDLKNYTSDKNNYINRGRMDKMAKELKYSYNHMLNEKLMQHTAFCWSFMGGQFWKGDSGTNHFYAYLPARNDDVLRVRPWNGVKRNMIDARRHRPAA